LGHKVHPIGFRLGIVRDWSARWYAEKQYAGNLYEDMVVRRTIQSKAPEAGISLVDIDRQGNDILVTIHSARPGIVIGRGGQRVEELRSALDKATKRKVRLTIREVEQPELVAVLVAKNVAEQIERRLRDGQAPQSQHGQTATEPGSNSAVAVHALSSNVLASAAGSLARTASCGAHSPIRVAPPRTNTYSACINSPCGLRGSSRVPAILLCNGAGSGLQATGSGPQATGSGPGGCHGCRSDFSGAPRAGR